MAGQTATRSSRSPSRRMAAQGKGCASSRVSAISRSRRSAVSRRASATATPSSATSRSTASSQRSSSGRSSRRRLRERRARSIAETRAPWAASTASTSRSRNRRRSPAAPRNSPSRSGVSQTTRRNSLNATGEAAVAPSIRQSRLARPSGPGGSNPVPRRCSAPSRSRVSETAKPPGPPLRAMAANSARRRPRPGTNSDSASSRLVLPAPFSPTSATKRARGVSSRSAWLRKSRAISWVTRREDPSGSPRGSETSLIGGPRGQPRGRDAPRSTVLCCLTSHPTTAS